MVPLVPQLRFVQKRRRRQNQVLCNMLKGEIALPDVPQSHCLEYALAARLLAGSNDSGNVQPLHPPNTLGGTWRRAQ
jgi:hypothetical protein